MMTSLDLENDRANAIIRTAMECCKADSRVQSLLESPGVSLAIAKMVTTSTDNNMLALNLFRVGASLAFEQAYVDKLIKGSE